MLLKIKEKKKLKDGATDTVTSIVFRSMCLLEVNSTGEKPPYDNILFYLSIAWSGIFVFANLFPAYLSIYCPVIG